MTESSGSRPSSPYGPDSATVRDLHGILNMEFGGFALSRQQLCKVLNNLFWASLRKEEGQPVVLRVLVADPDRTRCHFIKFDRRIPYSADTIAKISAGLSGTSNCLGIWGLKKGDPYIWGITEGLYDGLWLSVSEPGHITAYLWADAIADIVPGTRPRIMGPDKWQNFVFYVRDYFGHLLPSGIGNQFGWNLRFLAKAMVHGRGGTILLVTDDQKSWKQSLDFGYEVGTDKLEVLRKFDDFAKESEPLNDREPFDYQYWCYNTASEMSYTSTAKTIGQLTAIDGATVLSKIFVVLGFGAKIKAVGNPPDMLERIDPVIEPEISKVPFLEIGGTRHRSAAQFVQDNPGSLALVASQDGRVTLFGGVEDSRVRALRCESLLLFVP